MIEIRKGFRAGYTSGFIFGLLNALVTSVIYLLLIYAIPGEKSSSVQGVILFTISLLIPGKIIWGTLGGAAFGILFSFIYNKLPGSKIIFNIFLISILYWFFFSIILGSFFQKYYLVAYGISYSIDAVIGLFMFFIWGSLFKKFWNILQN